MKMGVAMEIATLEYYINLEDFEGEEWKRIGNLNYEVSNYGRIKNLTTKKLKKLR